MARSILIVEDELHIRTLLEQALEELEDDYGIEVLTASDGEEGLEKIRRESPEVVFLDIMMPKLNGYEVCRVVKADQDLQGRDHRAPHGQGPGSGPEKGPGTRRPGVHDKPFDPDEVVGMAKRLLNIHE